MSADGDAGILLALRAKAVATVSPGLSRWRGVG